MEQNSLLLFDRFEPEFRDILDRYGFGLSLDSCREMIRESTAIVMAHNNTAAMVYIVEQVAEKHMHILLVAGDLEEFREHLYPTIEQLARDKACDAITVCGRRGWVRALDMDEVMTFGVKRIK